MGFKCGIVGLPNVGKSTLFNALTSAGVGAENFPFCTIEPNEGVVAMPDSRLDKLASMVSPEKVIPTTMEFVPSRSLRKIAAKKGVSQLVAAFSQAGLWPHTDRRSTSLVSI